MLPRLVVVHPSHDEEEENCISSAGRKQRGSMNSLLLLEAHKLSMRTPASQGNDAGFMDAAEQPYVFPVKV